MTLSCDLFCTVIDNLGDAGVTWRLARQLATEQGWRVRLWIDDPAPLNLLAPDHATGPVDIHRWTTPFPIVIPADIVIEAFACELPANYVTAMAIRPRPPVWINLEYLSAEDWVVGCHGLASPHPTLPLVKYFFFPGFVPGTGGLILESKADFGLYVPNATLTISLFCYDNPALPRLLDTWANGDEPVQCFVAEGLPRRQVTLGQHGALTLTALPFLPQPDYDRLLGRCDLNFVRGEDSFVRAQWAQRPFVWQPYPQKDHTHHIKLDAFLSRYHNESIRPFWQAWNGKGDVGKAWPDFRAQLPLLTTHAEKWAQTLSKQGDLATHLARFCLARL
ncbi:MAG: elongation factor P maturation arginine rhamnosyltransferase EarP [Rhodocyclaceae bacterium]|nr:elongation factor P maturation arginine rhamnosyltransferase EarP [Rhodocyclaceae bacterium]